MSTSGVQGSFGVDWQVDIASTFTSVPNLRDVKFPKEEVVMAEITGHDSPSGAEEFIPSGKTKNPTVEMLVTWDASNSVHQQLETWRAAKTKLDSKFVSPDDTEDIEVEGYIVSMEFVASQDGSWDRKIVLQPTGANTYTETA